MDNAGCVLLPSNENLYVVPQSNFVALNGTCPAIKEQSIEPNVAYPADYSNFVLNDNCYKNIRYCFISCVGQGGATTSREGAIVSSWMGQYPENEDDIHPDDGASGVYVTQAPPWLGRNIGALFMLHSKQATDGLTSGTAHTDIGSTKEVTDVDQGKQAATSKQQEYDSKYGSQAEDVKKVLNKYAKARFLQEKYSDRTGSFSLQFNPQWVPATTGFLASRQPKVMFNFYVTSVTHHIEISGAQTGTASTHVNFNCARYGGDMGSIPTVDSNELYDYNEGSMKGLQSHWLRDNNANYSKRIK
jgi:hypothetical protein